MTNLLQVTFEGWTGFYFVYTHLPSVLPSDVQAHSDCNIPCTLLVTHATHNTTHRGRHYVLTLTSHR